MSSERDFLSVLMDAYFVVDEQRRLKEHNRLFQDLSGGRKPVAGGEHVVHCYDMVKLEICQRDCIALRALKAGRAVQVNEIRGKSLDGRDLVLMGSAAPLRDSAGDVSAVLVTYRDVTEETSVREKLHRLERESQLEKDVLLKNLTQKTMELDRLQQAMGGKKGESR